MKLIEFLIAWFTGSLLVFLCVGAMVLLIRYFRPNKQSDLQEDDHGYHD